jgi:hypothetical protein
LPRQYYDDNQRTADNRFKSWHNHKRLIVDQYGSVVINGKLVVLGDITVRENLEGSGGSQALRSI